MVALQQRTETYIQADADATTRLLNRGIARIPGLDARLTTGARVLVLGCGDGELIERLMRRYPLVIATVVDDDPQALAAVRARAGEGVTVVEASPGAYESERAFDLVLVHFALDRCGGIEHVAAQAFPELRERGLLVVSDTREHEGRDVAVLDRQLFWDASAFNLGPEHRIVHGSR